MAISRFKPDAVEDVLIGTSVEFQIEEADRNTAAGSVELDMWVQAVEVVQKSVQSVRSVVPKDKNVVLEATPQGGTEWRGVESSCFPFSEVEARKAAPERLAHRNAADLQPLSALESEVVAVK